MSLSGLLRSRVPKGHPPIASELALSPRIAPHHSPVFFLLRLLHLPMSLCVGFFAPQAPPFPPQVRPALRVFFHSFFWRRSFCLMTPLLMWFFLDLGPVFLATPFDRTQLIGFARRGSLGKSFGFFGLPLFGCNPFVLLDHSNFSGPISLSFFRD